MVQREVTCGSPGDAMASNEGAPRDRALPLLALSTLAVVAACSLTVDSDRYQCTTNDDCVGHGLSAKAICEAKVCLEPIALDAGGEAAPEDPIWGCLGKVPPPPAEEPGEPVHFRASFGSPISGASYEGLPVRACSSVDPDCAHPLDGTSVQTNADGDVDITLFSGFRGYLDVSPSVAVPNLMPLLVYALPVPDKRIGTNLSTAVRWGLLTTEEFNFIAGSAGKSIKPELGHLAFVTNDCRGRAAAGNLIRADTVTADTFTFYTDAAGTPSLTQAATTETGNGGFLNLPVGIVNLTMSRTTGQLVGKYTVIIRKGSVTSLLLDPTP